MGTRKFRPMKCPYCGGKVLPADQLPPDYNCFGLLIEHGPNHCGAKAVYGCYQPSGGGCHSGWCEKHAIAAGLIVDESTPERVTIAPLTKKCYCFGPPVKGCPTHDNGVTIEAMIELVGSSFAVDNVITDTVAGAFEDAYLDKEMKRHLEVRSDNKYPLPSASYGIPFVSYGRLSFYQVGWTEPPTETFYSGYIRWALGSIIVVLYRKIEWESLSN